MPTLLMKVVVTGIGLLSCLGSLDRTWQSLLAGKSGITPPKLFSEFSPFPLGLIGSQPITLNKLTKIIVAAAIEDASLTPPLPNCGVAIGSSRACQASWEKLVAQMSLRGKKNISWDESWLDMLPNRGAITGARLLGTTAPVLAPMAACATGIWALARAFDSIQRGDRHLWVAGAVEAPISPLTIAGFQRMGALAATGCYPFDKYREGLVLAEGGAVLVLESVESALKRGVRIYGQLLGFGFTCDAHHLTSPEPSGKNAIRGIEIALERSNLEAREIDYIHAHGTSTKLNDGHEAKIIQHVFPFGVPVSSTKGATGHTLGASGAMGAAFCLLALRHGVLPPSVGLKEPEFELDLVTEARQKDIGHGLCFSFGFGGQNAVMVLKKYP